MRKVIAQIKVGLGILFLIILIGTVGFEIIEEEWNLLDSFYMTIITVTTTGFQEVHPLSPAGRLLTVFLIVSGVLTIAYIGGKGAQLLIEKQIFRRRRMGKLLEVMANHYVVCGYGRMGKQICESLKDTKELFVVIENDENKIAQLEEQEMMYVKGDATNDDILVSAGVARAKGLVAVVRTDAENVFTTLSAKELNPKLFVVARAIEEGSESKLKKAGADRVVLPYELGGNRMVQLLLRPGVIDFIDSVARNKDVDISLEELTISNSSSLIGLSLAESPVKKEFNIMIVAIIRKDGSFIYNPQSSIRLEDGDKLIAIGESDNLHKLTEKCGE